MYAWKTGPGLFLWSLGIFHSRMIKYFLFPLHSIYLSKTFFCFHIQLSRTILPTCSLFFNLLAGLLNTLIRTQIWIENMHSYTWILMHNICTKLLCMIEELDDCWILEALMPACCYIERFKVQIAMPVWVKHRLWDRQLDDTHHNSKTRQVKFLTHWGRATHNCVSKLTIIGSDNGLSPGRRQAIIWNNAGLL